MKPRQPLKRAVGRTLLAGGIALAGLALASGTAQAEPEIPFAPDISGAGGLLDECGMCQRLLPAVLPVVISEMPPEMLEVAGNLAGLG